MSRFPKKNDQLRCITSRNCDTFSHGCLYDVEKVSKAKRLVYVYGDDGDIHEIDFPQDITKGHFEIND
ncbi:hypothetical protein bas12_0081 [Escherichia phage BrunoManser]|uniref:Uncharacterized protein n=1 Tax=Escherichia phage BrunoManser TaxID=2851976 RepID=A0AAE7VPU1_9CAUD|nr:hypothetical protein bas12_0081 [Escherichia phage BrunoManser]